MSSAGYGRRGRWRGAATWPEDEPSGLGRAGGVSCGRCWPLWAASNDSGTGTPTVRFGGSSTIAVVPPYRDWRSCTLMPWRSASRPTTYRPSRAVLARSNSGGLASRSLASASSSSAHAEAAVLDLDRVAAARPTGRPTRTLVCGGENEVAFSISSASRWMTSPTARPASADVVDRQHARPGCSPRPRRRRRAPRRPSAPAGASAAAGAAPESTIRFSALRRMRVARWSSRNSSSSSSASVSRAPSRPAARAGGASAPGCAGPG